MDVVFVGATLCGGPCVVAPCETDCLRADTQVCPYAFPFPGSVPIVMDNSIADKPVNIQKVKDIYAAGDCTETMDVVYHDRRCNALWPTAVEQGHIAAMNMAGIAVAYPGSIGRNVMGVFDLSIFAAGKGKLDGDAPIVKRDRGKDYYHKIVLDSGKLAGAIFVGEFKNEGFYLNLMQRKIDVAYCADALLQGTFSYPRFLALGMNGNLGIKRLMGTFPHYASPSRH